MASIVTLGLASLLLNISIARGLWKHHREHRKIGSTELSTWEAEMKICVVTFIMFLTSIVAFVVQSIFFAYGAFNVPMSMHMIQTLSRTQNFSEDLHIFTQPWMLIAMSRAIREKVRSLVVFLPPPQSETGTAAVAITSRRVSVVGDRRMSVVVTHK
ncbi:hypothetical protein AAVH_29000 [Aphelenchoides avenae]|nr:hypothetical protein AAVH_29000 [Aphelenchus avenae]